MNSFNHTISDRNLFQQQLLIHFRDAKNVVFLNSNDSSKTNLLAISNSDFVSSEKNQFGFISYDYKNKIEDLYSEHYDGLEFPEKHFFTPQILFKIGESIVEIYFASDFEDKNATELIAEIESISVDFKESEKIKIIPRISKNEYLTTIIDLKKHIQLGDIYEVNFCQEYYAEQVDIDPIDIYIKLNKKSPTPFSCFVKFEDKYLISASPERYIQKNGNKILSQPIKGTAKRGDTLEEDELIKKELFNDPKERSENVMIVDLVRNDLSKIAKKDSVVVNELCGIYTFPQVHQMISTVSGEVKKEVDFDAILKATFPMGSMTGAPKLRAMKLIEKYEKTKRGLYSGTVGYINDKGDFDFSVVIRSIAFNSKNNYLSFMVGGAITNQSDPEKEYDECLLKAKAMLEVLSE
ncbi:MAG: anthranilate synthase component I family protein [Vicingaceae bacterium]|jgi:para-aminobenzoate synthetase component 1